MTTSTISDTSRERFTEMIRVLKAAEPTGFSLATWFGNPKVITKSVIAKLQAINTTPITATDCGTTACACGTAALDPWFIAQGFHLRAAYGAGVGMSVAYTRDDYTYEDWTAVLEFFELTWNEADRLFLGMFYNMLPPETHLAEVIRRIEFYLGGGDLVQAYQEC